MMDPLEKRIENQVLVGRALQAVQRKIPNERIIVVLLESNEKQMHPIFSCNRIRAAEAETSMV